MPTSRPRHTITESDEIAEALRDAAHRWPEDRDSPSVLLRRLVAEGHDALTERLDADARAHRASITATHGALSGVYPAEYLATLRDDWPA